MNGLWQFVRTLVAAFLIAFAVPHMLRAEISEHVVSPTDLQKAAANASQSRTQNMTTLNSFLSSDQAAQAMHSAHVSPQQVKKAVAGLSDAELAQLASRANKAQADFSAGYISNGALVLLIIAIVVVIIVVAAVH